MGGGGQARQGEEGRVCEEGLTALLVPQSPPPCDKTSIAPSLWRNLDRPLPAAKPRSPPPCGKTSYSAPGSATATLLASVAGALCVGCAPLCPLCWCARCTWCTRVQGFVCMSELRVQGFYPCPNISTHGCIDAVPWAPELPMSRGIFRPKTAGSPPPCIP